MSTDIRPIAFYLPQYHPIPENDNWWGKGFTEWNNVAKGKPLFKGHYQPHLPADLGFYDLRVPEARQAQADLAKAYGIYGFCYYHYWFNGKRLLERPIDEVLKSGQPDFPFCLCWANENWTRRWDGHDNEILMEQQYSAESDKAHIRYLAGIFRDPRYIRIQGKPLFLVYRASRIPNPKKTVAIWREEAHKLGLGELFLCKVESFVDEQTLPSLQGFDAAVEFQPKWHKLGSPLKRGYKWKLLQKAGIAGELYARNKIYNYTDIVQRMLALDDPDYLRFPCVTPGWDNTARRKNGAVILHNSTPDAYYKWLLTIAQKVKSNPQLEGILFINAWNEWAEGNHLEPCQRWGRQYLEATKSALLNA